MRRRLVLIVAVTANIAACGGDDTPASPTPSSGVSLAGTWAGTISDPVSGEGIARLSLSDAGQGSLTGTWLAALRNGENFSGPAVASVVTTTNGYGISLYVEPQPPCATGSSALLGFTLINVVVTSSRLTAAAGRLSCSGISFGSVELSKQ